MSTNDSNVGTDEYLASGTGATPTYYDERYDEPLGTDPGKTLGIIAIIVSVVFGLLGIALGFVSDSKSRDAGYSGGYGMAAVIIGAVGTMLFLLYLILLASGLGFGGVCDGLAPGQHTLDDGTRVSCQ